MALPHQDICPSNRHLALGQFLLEAHDILQLAQAFQQVVLQYEKLLCPLRYPRSMLCVLISQHNL